MVKSADAFRTISEVAEWLGVQTHVLRFWESKFSQIKPVKRAGGRRYFRPADMLLLGGIRKLLHEDGLTIKGAQKVLREKGIEYVADLSQPLDEEVLEGVAGPAEAPTKLVVPPMGAVEADQTPKADQQIPDQATAPEDDQNVPAQASVTSLDQTDALPVQAASAAPTYADFASDPAAVDPEPSEKTEPALGAVDPVTPDDAIPAASVELDTSSAPLEIDAPDPPLEDQIEVGGGALNSIAKLRRLTDKQRTEISPLVEQLQALRERYALRA